MVEFCRSCKGSLPRADLTVKEGATYTSHDYVCPQCGRLANPPPNPSRTIHEPSRDYDVLIQNGETHREGDRIDE